MSQQSKFAAQEPSQWLDLKRYPITDSASAGYKALVTRCQQQLAELGAAELPGFVLDPVCEAMATEADELATVGYHSTVTGNAYLEPGDPSLPDDHPKNMVETTALAAVAYDQFPTTSLVRRLYEWNPLMKFLADCLGEPQLYRYADPMGALNISVMKEGDYLRWHFDQTDFVTSVTLQSSEVGGEFEFVPMIRTPKDECFAAVKALLEGDRSQVRKIPVVPGTLLLFRGRYSIHRVTPIEGPKLRHMALFGFDTKPGVTSSAHLQRMRYGRTASK